MATQSIKGSLYEEKILNLIKSKMQIIKKISVEEADKLILDKNQNFSKLKISQSKKVKKKALPNQKS